MYYKQKRPSKGPLVYHFSNPCYMVTQYPTSYVQVSKPPAGYRACRHPDCRTK